MGLTLMSLLEVTSLTKSFGGLMAVSGVDIRIDPGDILGMIGPNGAGKTTVFNLITGIYKPDKGSVVGRALSASGRTPSPQPASPAPFRPSGYFPR